jgi:hypothetical protein
VRGRQGVFGLALGGLCLGLLYAPGVRAADFTYKAVAFLDTKAPGGGMLVNDFEPGAVSAQGEVAFVVDYQPPDTTGEGLYLASGGQLIPIVEPGKTAVGDWSFASEGEIDAIISPVAINGNGDVSFGCDILKRGESDVKTGTFLWQRKTGQVIAVSLPDGDAPGGGKFGTIQGHTWTDVNDQGDVVFSVQVPDATGDMEQGVFVRLADGTYKSIARPGDASPDGGHFTRARRPNINNAGAVVFEGKTDKADTNGIYLAANGTIKAIAAAGTEVGNGATKEPLQDVQNGRLDNLGEVIFLGETAAGWGLYRFANDKIETLAAPGATLRDGAKVGEVLQKDGTISLSPGGTVAMIAQLDGGDDAVYLLQGDQARLVAKADLELPGVGTVDEAEGEHVAVNDLGQVAFQAKLADGRTALVLASPAQ